MLNWLLRFWHRIDGWMHRQAGVPQQYHRSNSWEASLKRCNERRKAESRKELKPANYDHSGPYLLGSLAGL